MVSVCQGAVDTFATEDDSISPCVVRRQPASTSRGIELWAEACVPVKSEEQQASALVFRTHDLMVRQRTQLINAIRGHLTECDYELTFKNRLRLTGRPQMGSGVSASGGLAATVGALRVLGPNFVAP